MTKAWYDSLDELFLGKATIRSINWEYDSEEKLFRFSTRQTGAGSQVIYAEHTGTATTPEKGITNILREENDYAGLPLDGSWLTREMKKGVFSAKLGRTDAFRHEKVFEALEDYRKKRFGRQPRYGFSISSNFNGEEVVVFGDLLPSTVFRAVRKGVLRDLVKAEVGAINSEKAHQLLPSIHYLNS